MEGLKLFPIQNGWSGGSRNRTIPLGHLTTPVLQACLESPSEFAGGIPRQARAVQRLENAVGRFPGHQRIPVGRCFGAGVIGDAAAGARLVLDDEGMTGEVGDFLHDHARDEIASAADASV